MRHKDIMTLRRIGLGVTGLAAALVVAVGVADAFTGPGSAGGVGYGAIATDASSNVAVGMNATEAATKFAVRASSTSSGAYAVRVSQPGDVGIFYVRNDGVTNMATATVSNSLTVGGVAVGGTMTAANVSAGTFGANTGNGNFTFPANLTVTSALTLTAQTASRVLAVDGSKAVASTFASQALIDSLSDETGSGASVFGTQPTFTTDLRTPMVIGGTGVGSSLTLKSTTGVGSSDYVNVLVGNNGATEALRVITGGNVGIGDTSPAYKLTVGSGDLFGVDSSGYAYHPAGAASTPSVTFTGDTNTGFYSAGSDVMHLTTGGTARVTVNGSGNVGIGQTNPATYKLEVAGTIYSSTGGFRFPDGTTQTTAATGSSSTISAANVSAGTFGANTGNGNFIFPADLRINGSLGVGGNPESGYELDVNYGNGERFRVGLDVENHTEARLIGKTAAYVVEDSNTGITGYFGSAGLSNRIDLAASVKLVMSSGGTVDITSGGGNGVYLASTTGNFGVGDSSPTYLFTVGSGDLFGVDSSGYAYHPTGAASTPSVTFTGDTNTGMYSGGADTIAWTTGGTQRMTLAGTTLTVGGGTGKINVGTVDPIYEIGGEKFATYMAGMIGVKEEVAGDLAIPCSGGRCERTIDFADEPKGSDLWLFGKVTDIRKHLKDASILLTPAFDGRVSYRKGDGAVTIIAQPFEPADEVEVSYRFTAPRFDAEQWGNRTDDEAAGFVID